ncbi:hypothetical protein IF1G_01943 [Cordyceps javanica]|uniref:Uncharacterized protein n=1 Tax=Cordyceps javanica TaxID=43265 RepID=A0A545VDC5_9HYPO|nr:hypothetical protein IF1G_01943 [Cordyceps javanica]
MSILGASAAAVRFQVTCELAMRHSPLVSELYGVEIEGMRESASTKHRKKEATVSDCTR